ncbi:ANTAR domain-containing response regulator [Paraburkholderia aspalathi]|jgi:two-component system, response regulator PdtaR|uniref:Two-component response regulator, AmiR/NasT family, consists of REC and RNA-binding antiterminator (ANTAR) domains n=1 Tax=Paraburkholderia aspalathi TaxID=1324617 RepID=A0A1I6ZN51_9BURK|nr:ANTAR domain-containing protein [Paraburkholderia aspalathi]MBK3842252.1 ANTAR domain-containing protein [Paraburkholderia aspalathi]CAE6795598.1 Aliphatic amidase regulator [Paraburkholderia aspalathi]CAE6826596.1 Aliphatic amidase regulator [Paraburkholderia aspalathi]SFT64133.1 Two-component response regulator, AmiR/NasT family, consists of REC and RNA-binding antiterminator (ANTAR) domains [Paraburkholderia aspalathi]
MSTGARRLFDDLRTLRVLVIHPPGEDRIVLEEQLRRIGCQVRVLWPFPSQLPADVDAIFFLVGPETRSAGNWCAADTEATLIALSDYENPTALKMLVDTQAHGVITKPYRSTGILSTLVLARASSGYQQRLHSKVSKLEEAIKARRHIEKAIRILMEAHQLSESNAYEHMRSRATSLRVTVSEIATLVIDAHEAMEKLGLGKGPKP